MSLLSTARRVLSNTVSRVAKSIRVGPAYIGEVASFGIFSGVFAWLLGVYLIAVGAEKVAAL